MRKGIKACWLGNLAEVCRPHALAGKTIAYGEMIEWKGVVMFKKFMIVINLFGSLCVFTLMCMSRGLHKSKKYR